MWQPKCECTYGNHMELASEPVVAAMNCQHVFAKTTYLYTNLDTFDAMIHTKYLNRMHPISNIDFFDISSTRNEGQLPCRSIGLSCINATSSTLVTPIGPMMQARQAGNYLFP